MKRCSSCVSQPFGARKPRPEELEQQKRAELNKAPVVGKSNNLPTPPQHINDHEMIRRDILPPGSGLIPSLEALAREVIDRVFSQGQAAPAPQAARRTAQLRRRPERHELGARH